MVKKVKIYVPDTSAIINGNVTELINSKKLDGEIIIPEFVISELENQANRGKEIGFEGLDELKNLRELCADKKIKFSEFGRKPTSEEIKLAKSGRIDSLIKDIAKEHGAILITADIVQAKSAEAVGLEVIYFKKEELTTLKIENYFDKETMSVHLKEGCAPKAKKGKPGNVELVVLFDDILDVENLEIMAHEVTDVTRTSNEAFIEMGQHGATVVQYKNYRIAITRPPFSKDMEITVVRPIMKADIDSYVMSDKLKQRLKSHAEGIILAGPPGHGKSTLAQALAEFYQKQGKIVKTMEKPRDLQVGPEITQYGALSGDMEKTVDLLLLVRPDFTIYDEVRKTKDFRLFSDMRLAGVGMVGVVHATEAIDAVHRFIGRIELGMIPQIIDTIVYIKDGAIKTVYTLKLGVRVPTGMKEQDLARPVIDVIDFETGKLVYEIYTYGEQTVVIPVLEEADLVINKLACEQLTKILKKYIKNPNVEIVSSNSAIVRVLPEEIPAIIGKGGSNITKLEKLAGINLSVEPIIDTLKKEVKFSVSESGGYVIIELSSKYIGHNVDVYFENDYVFSATVGKKSQIKVKKKSDSGISLLKAVAMDGLKVLVE